MHLLSHIWLWLKASGYIREEGRADYQYHKVLRNKAEHILPYITDDLECIYHAYLSNEDHTNHLAKCNAILREYFAEDGGRDLVYQIDKKQSISIYSYDAIRSSFLRIMFYLALTPNLDLCWTFSNLIQDHWKEECIYVKKQFFHAGSDQELLDAFREHMGVDYGAAILMDSTFIYSGLYPTARMPHTSKMRNIKRPTFFVTNSDWNSDYYVQGVRCKNGLVRLRGKVPASHEYKMRMDPNTGTVYERFMHLYPRNLIVGKDLLSRLLSPSVMCMFGIRIRKMDKVITLVYKPLLSMDNNEAILQITYDGRIFICDLTNSNMAYQLMCALASNIHLITPIGQPTEQTVESFVKTDSRPHKESSSHNPPSRRFPVLGELIGKFPTVTKCLSSGRVISIYHGPGYLKSATSILFVRDVLRKKQPILSPPYLVSNVIGSKNLGYHHLFEKIEETIPGVTAKDLATRDRVRFDRDGKAIYGLYFDEPYTPFFSVIVEPDMIVTRYPSHTMYTIYENTLNTSASSTRDNRTIILPNIDLNRNIKYRVEFRLSNSGMVVNIQCGKWVYRVITPLKLHKRTAMYSCLLGPETGSDITNLYNSLAHTDMLAEELMDKIMEYAKEHYMIPPVPTALLWTVYGPHNITASKKFMDYVPVDPVRETSIFEHIFHQCTIGVFIMNATEVMYFQSHSQQFWEPTKHPLCLYMYETLQHAWAFEYPAFHYAVPIGVESEGLSNYMCDRSISKINNKKVRSISDKAVGVVIDDNGCILYSMNAKRKVLQSKPPYLVPRHRIPMVFDTASSGVMIESSILWFFSHREVLVMNGVCTSLYSIWDSLNVAAEHMICQLVGASSMELPDIGSLPRSVPVLTGPEAQDSYRRIFAACNVKFKYENPEDEQFHPKVLTTSVDGVSLDMDEYDDESIDLSFDIDEIDIYDPTDDLSNADDDCFDSFLESPTSPVVLSPLIGKPRVVHTDDIDAKCITILHRRTQWTTPLAPVQTYTCRPPQSRYH